MDYVVIGAVVILLTIFVYFLFFRKTKLDESPPVIYIGNVTQVTNSVNKSGNVEGYRTEYYTDEDLSKYIDFTVEWVNGFGFQNVTHIKLVNYVDGNELRSRTFSGDSPLIDNFTKGISVKFSGVSLASDDTIPTGVTSKSLKGTNTFKIFYSTDNGINYNEPKTIPNETRFPTINITDTELNVPLTMAKDNSITYVFQPNVKSESFKISSTFLDELYYIHPVGKKISIQQSLYIDTIIQNNKPIVISKSNTVVPVTSPPTPTPVNFFLKYSETDFRLLYLDSEKIIRVSTNKQIPSDVTGGNADFYIIESTLTQPVSGKTHYHIKEYGTKNNFITLNNGLRPNFKSLDITTITSATVYSTIEFIFTKSMSDLAVDCVTGDREIYGCETENGGNTICEDGKALERGQKCIQTYYIKQPMNGGRACSKPVGNKAVNCAVNCTWKRKLQRNETLGCNNPCRRIGTDDPVSNTYDYEEDLPSKNGGSCNNSDAPSPAVVMCPPKCTTNCTWVKFGGGVCSKNKPYTRVWDTFVEMTNSACNRSPSPSPIEERDTSCPGPSCSGLSKTDCENSSECNWELTDIATQNHECTIKPVCSTPVLYSSVSPGMDNARYPAAYVPNNTTLATTPKCIVRNNYNLEQSDLIPVIKVPMEKCNTNKKLDKWSSDMYLEEKPTQKLLAGNAGAYANCPQITNRWYVNRAVTGTLGVYGSYNMLR